MHHRVTEDTEPYLNQLSGKIIACAIKVHRVLGPGLLESAYETCLLHEIRKSGLQVERQVPLPVVYDGIRLDAGYQLDLVVEKGDHLGT